MSKVQRKIDTAIIEAVSKVVRSNDTVAIPSDIKPISDAVREEITPMVINATNNEPWYQSTIIMGALLTIGLKALAQLGWAVPEELHGPILDLIIGVGPYITAGAIILSRKGFFSKPLGHGPILGWIFNRKL